MYYIIRLPSVTEERAKSIGSASSIIEAENKIKDIIANSHYTRADFAIRKAQVEF